MMMNVVGGCIHDYDDICSLHGKLSSEPGRGALFVAREQNPIRMLV